MKTITCNIKNMLYLKNIQSKQNVQYHKVQITNFFSKWYTFNYTQDQFQNRLYGCDVC